MKTSHGALTVDTRVNFWPALIDMLTSILMFFLLVFFVEQNFSAASAELAVARQKQARFAGVFHGEFRDEIARGQVADTTDLSQLQIRFGDGVLFEPGRYELSPRGEALLERLAQVFHAVDASGTHLYEEIQIEGHTDDMRMEHASYPRDNWELSTARAMSVLKYLTRRASPPLRERRMSVNGYAQNRPISERRSRNRRIEIRIVFSGRAPLETRP
jgi:chemotaxis protein MotB